MTIEELNELIKKPEGVSLEFKSAQESFSTTKDLPDYCAALANEGGGKLLLGVNKFGKITGTKAFMGSYNMISHDLLRALSIRVDVQEIETSDGRVLVFDIAGRRPGQIIQSTGKYKYPMRAGESLVEMDLGTIKKILNEYEEDFSAKIVAGLSADDLDKNAIQILKKLWSEKSKKPELRKINTHQILNDLCLVTQNGLTYSSLVLLGKSSAIEKYLPDAEIIFEWRQDPNKISHDSRKAWRLPFLLCYQEIWDEINSRNLRMPFQEGFVQKEIFSFNEKTVREALMNAIAHRDYSIKGRSIFIKASPESLRIQSPGGLLMGITLENILSSCAWRNRLLAETLEKSGLVERAGQGLNDIFLQTITDGKGAPDLSETTINDVVLTIPGVIKDKNFIIFLEKIANQKQITFSSEEILELENIRSKRVSNTFHRDKLLNIGIIERVGVGRGSHYILSHKYYASEGHAGIHTRISGLSRDQKKELILNHFKKNKRAYMKEFLDVFPDMKNMDISNLLRELREEGKIKHVGFGRKGFWTQR